MGASEEWKLQLHRHPVTWAIPPPLSTCGSGVLYCGSCDNFGTGPTQIAFGSPWPVSFPLAWNIAHGFFREKCEVNCFPHDGMHLFSRLLDYFPLGTPTDGHMSRKQEIFRVFKSLDLVCSDSAVRLEDVLALSNCTCDLASVVCKVKPESWEGYHEVKHTDMMTPLISVANIFRDYRDDTDDIGTCAYACWQLKPEAKQIVEANKAVDAIRRATRTTTRATTSAPTRKRTSASPARKRTSAPHARKRPASPTRGPQIWIRWG
ncbi:hypothetical protein GNI_154790 [Gregarina niphandrodes]|uniref:Uncharacterized protein n=1 Tax=Gregarina niphandrodes TaxID=110365 RepID=A0A023AZ75_GRENI|nr:hypothetical protein GNI_154790 [Gregarina niphandrodes]EZG43980.1 hypothetical protein GNI_154790 [Gregarina niphandrodes]|eukprot:XP_011132862.1 hypothetical protein GNI_154790 [Gregarina niphandrodes]